MNKVEFEARVTSLAKGATVEVPATDYKVIEFVYNYHPAIDNVTGKDQIAMLYFNFGMVLIYDMLETAQEAMRLQEELAKAKAHYDATKAALERLKHPNKVIKV